MKPIVVAFLGRAGSGKSTAAKHLVNKYDATPVSFAGPLKKMARQLWDFSEEQVYGDAVIKEEVDSRWGISPRTAMQRLGDAGRQCIHLNVWFNAAIERIVQDVHCEGKKLFAIDDARYVNEVRLLNDSPHFHTFIVKLLCSDSISMDDGLHPSEAEIDQVPVDQISCQLTSQRSPNSKHLLDAVDAFMANLSWPGK